jgi:hypothetical protein
MSDHRWNDQGYDKHTGFTSNFVVLGIGGHEERRGRGRKEGGRRETEKRKTEFEEIRMADGQQDTTQRGPLAWRIPARLFGSPPVNFSLSDPPVRVRL